LDEHYVGIYNRRIRQAACTSQIGLPTSSRVTTDIVLILSEFGRDQPTLAGLFIIQVYSHQQHQLVGEAYSRLYSLYRSVSLLGLHHDSRTDPGKLGGTLSSRC
jgi:hypothetical protein